MHSRQDTDAWTTRDGRHFVAKQHIPIADILTFCTYGLCKSDSFEFIALGYSTSWEDDTHSASQEMSRLLWNRMFITVFLWTRHMVSVLARWIHPAPS